MAKHTIHGFVTWKQSSYETKPTIGFYAFRPEKEYFPDMVVISEHSIEVEVPDDFDPRPELVKSLQAQQQKARADFEKLCTDIQRQINELQALELA